LLKFSTASRAEKHPNLCAEGATEAFGAEKGGNSCAEGNQEAFGAEKGIIFCAECDTYSLTSRKMPQILRGRCSGAVPGRKKGDFLK
jgi:hypothetical protein